MNELWKILADALARGEDAVLCGIIESTGSAPRTSGARMLVLADGTVRGTVGGGPVEGASLERARQMLARGESHVTLPFDLNSHMAARAGMVCGGEVTVLLQRVTREQSDFFVRVGALHAARRQGVLLTVLRPEQPPLLALWSLDGLEGTELPAPLISELEAKARKTRQPFGLDADGIRVFAEPLVAATVVHLVGAGHVALATAKVAAFAGFEVVVMDDREEFANTERYPEARSVRVLESFDQCLSDLGPDDYVVIVTRGHLHDRDVLAQALRTTAGYIGMIGSRSKRDAVYRSLLEAGATQADLDRVFCPIGLAIGADTPEEIAVSIVAEMIRVRAGLA